MWIDVEAWMGYSLLPPRQPVVNQLSHTFTEQDFRLMLGAQYTRVNWFEMPIFQPYELRGWFMDAITWHREDGI